MSKADGCVSGASDRAGDDAEQSDGGGAAPVTGAGDDAEQSDVGSERLSVTRAGNDAASDVGHRPPAVGCVARTTRAGCLPAMRCLPERAYANQRNVVLTGRRGLSR